MAFAAPYSHDLEAPKTNKPIMKPPLLIQFFFFFFGGRG